ncbi:MULTISPECIES: helix-turn-helix transcriptional regulator [unclassified Curtobacterium]|uniref:helix-turn-helix transcriptional regulator n=1 Tax=unclassified Curtobacterium TaxID=257496 RepID=UPI000F4B949A|nr:MULTISPECIES: helix-turn-helix transcriptional regulator [unclassified Curtobacterium]ROP64838.1 helix-turn-helix protein [Curtobacterium sp. ZW137]TCK63758.1 helix-turn-helix protein [Curtobacterium sp. PhB136]
MRTTGVRLVVLTRVGDGPHVVEHRVADRATNDRAIATRLYEDRYHAQCIGFGTDTAFRLRHRSIRDLHVELLNAAVSTERHGVVDPGDGLVFGWTATGGARIGTGAEGDVTLPGVPETFPVARPFSFSAPAGVHHLVRIDLAFLRAVGRLVEPDVGDVPTLNRRPRSDGLPGLRAAIAAVASAAVSGDDSAVVRSSLQVELAESVLAVFGTAQAGEPSVGEPSVGGRAARRTLEAARSWAAAHCGGPVTLSDLCGAADVSARTLQSAFLQEAGRSPMAFVQDMRLDRVRVVLQLADPGVVTVGGVARDWGFRHMGRFSAAYAQRFGEFPAETLRNAPTRRLRVRSERRTA